MEKWSFNGLLFSRLSDVLGMSGAEIARRCGLTQQVLNRYMNDEIVLSVQALIKICNALRMPAYYFVSEDECHILPNRESATLPPEQWQPVTWDSQAAELAFGDGDGKIYWKDVADAMGVTSQKPHERFLLKTRFPVDDFLRTCSRLDISPYRFLIDGNRDAAKSRRKVQQKGGGALAAEVRDLTRKLSDLNARYDELLRRYAALLDRHNLLERTVRDYLGEDSTTAAEPET